MEPEGVTPYSQVSAIGLYPGPILSRESTSAHTHLGYILTFKAQWELFTTYFNNK